MELSRSKLPPRPGPKMDFVTVRNVQPIDYIILSEQVWAHDVHWIGDRTAPCTNDKGTCEYCQKTRPVRWRGYLHALPYSTGGKAIFLCLTPACGWELLQGIEPNYSFRGRRISVWRSGKSATSLMQFRWVDHWTAPHELPQAIDPGPFLDTVFRKRKPLAD